MTTAVKANTSLGTIELGDSVVYAAALPRPTKSVIVSYDSVIRISCVIPAKKYNIVVSQGAARTSDKRGVTPKRALRGYEQKTVKAPSLILSFCYADVPTFKNVRGVASQVYLYAYKSRNKDKSVIWGAPYLISNVHATGSICFGEMRPLNPREAFTTFWGSPFNNELLGEHEELEIDSDYEDVSDYIDDYHDSVYQEQPWEDLTPTLCGKKFWGCPKNADAVLITSDRQLLNQIPKKFWKKFNNAPFIIAKGKYRKRNWKFETGGLEFSLSHKNITFKAAKTHRIRAY